MKVNITTVILSIVACAMLNAQARKDTKFTNTDKFMNPVFSGDYPDPSILADGDDYYVVHSSFEYYPGLTIWHSKDLISWNPIKSALTKYIGSVWAPDLVKHNGKYYIYFPANNTNYVIVADAIDGKWSDPIDLKIGNIDPGHVADDKGNRYLYFSSGGYVQLSKDGLSVVGEFKHVYDGWPIPRDWTIECFCMEGPKLFKRGQYYYLTVAEGGTAGPATGHMVISARSKSPLGPWENSPYNPIIRAQSTSDRWWSVGHGTVFENASHEWWMMFHGYEKDHYNMGRQTLLAPVEWTEDGWYKLPDDFDLEKPTARPAQKPFKSTYSLNDDFEGNELDMQWKFFGKYDPGRYNIANNSIEIIAKGGSIPESLPLLTIPADHSYSAQVEIEIEGDAIAGLVLFYNHKIYSGILADHKNILANLRGWQFPTEKDVINDHVYLKLKNVNNVVDMYYSTDGTRWVKIENSFDASGYHHNVLSDFLSLRIGLVSMGRGKVRFKDFKYEPIK
ncbi:family 43 glycosylhydrolase [Fulvivirga ulvae]|uniref:family 43 glycosylhydrolase n=1 Tax=Fulvivirga ulvae TaxID=2904245 RepID=UPI001F1E937F|nr:family 43 glycosylhydrolase [Fulvivirga ulvae]UII33080.1 family 43 glycosylhydrolase [Fulvivirga ulvae]